MSLEIAKREDFEQFFKFKRNLQSYAAQNNTLLQIAFQASVDKVIHERRIYTFWEFLSDVGGLNEWLSVCGYYFVIVFNYVCGSGLSRHLFSQLFKFEAPDRQKK